MRELRFRWLEGGACRHFESSTLRGGRWQLRDYPSFFGVLEHPEQGIFLFDTGYSPRFFSATAHFPEKLYALATPVRCAEADTCHAQLPGLGLRPEDVRGIFLSHLHADHLAALHYFPRAKIHFAGAGLRRMQSLSRLRQVLNGFLAELLPADIWERAVQFEQCRQLSLPGELLPFTDGFDLLGDGALLGVPLTGHMLGHTGLFFRSTQGPVLLLADAVWHSESYRRLVGPSPLASLLMADSSAYQLTLRRLHELHSRGTGLALVPSHCPEFRGRFLA